MTDRRPSLLWVTQEVPDRAGGGGAIRQAALLLRLSSEYAIDLLVAGRVVDPAVRSAVRSVVELDVPSRPPPGRLRTAWELAVRRRPLFLAASARARRALGSELRARAGAYDAVVLHHEELAPLLAEVQGALRILHVFDVKGARAAQAAAVAPARRSAAVWRAEAAAARRVERRWLPSADLVVACTGADLAALAAAAGGPLAAGAIVPNGVDLDAVAPSPAPRGRRALFLGSLDYAPNVDGITWFARAVWPAVVAAEPTATLTVAGHRPAPEVLALGSLPGIEVVGPVPDAPACVAAHDVVVVPLRIGTGSRLKALEAMAAARPVVGTTVGLEGLPTDGALVADDPAALAAAVVAVLRDPDRAAAVGAAGRASVEAGFGWDPIARTFAEAVRGALGPRGATDGVAVLVCTRGRPDLLAASLASLDAALGEGDELLVVEADGLASAPLVAGLRGPARHLAAPRPGKSRQLNQGLRATGQEVVVLTDDDCEVDPAWVRAMAAPFADPAVGAAFGPVLGLSGVRGVDEPSLAPGEPPAVTWEYANGAAMAVRRRAVLELGGFDERLGPGAPVHGEEHDLVLRLQEAGWTVRIADAPPVRHLDWRDEAATRANLLVYSRGAGACVGAPLRRAPRRHLRLAARRVRYQASLWRHHGAEGAGFGPATSWAFARGLVHGLALRPRRGGSRAQGRRPSS